MTKRLSLVLVCALAAVASVAGCGGSQTKTGPTSGLSLKQIKQLNKTNTARSVAYCHQAANNPGLPANLKGLMETECQYIQSGNYPALHAIDRQICKVQADQMSEPQRSKDLAQCKTL